MGDQLNHGNQIMPISQPRDFLGNPIISNKPRGVEMIKPKKEVIYLAGPYRGATPEETAENIETARSWAIKLWDLGYIVLCPHLNSANFERDCQDCTDEEFLEGCIELMSRCDRVALFPRWLQSTGTRAEIRRAIVLGIPFWPVEIFFDHAAIAQ